MPQYRIKAPDGRTFLVTGEGTQEEALAQVQARYAQQQASLTDRSEYDPSSREFQAKYGPTAGMSGVERFAAGAGKAFTDLARGAGQLAGVVDNEDVATSRELDAPLMESGAAKAGNIAGNIAAFAPVAFVPGANTVAGAAVTGAAFGALQPTTSATERLVNTGVGAAAGAATQYVGQKIAGFVGKSIAGRRSAASSRAAQNAVRDATLAESRKAGYVVPPSTTNPTAANRLIEGVSGKAATQQAASVRNQQVTNSLIRRDLGLKPDAPLTTKTLEGIRQKAGGAYRAMKAIGQVTVDSDYLDDLARLGQGIDDVAKDFPDANVGANNDISDLVDSLLRDKFQASSAVEYAKQLRFAAKGNFSAPDPTKRALAHAQRDAAGALEDMLLRHLNSTGKGQLATRFNRARTLIAKTYSVEGALNESTGNVVAKRLATELKRGKPLTGGIETAAKFAQAFPKAAEEVTHSPGVSAVDALVGGVGGTTVNPSLFALPAARVGTRSAILSNAYQRFAVPSYSPRTGTLQALEASARRAAIPGIVGSVEAVQE